jgi:hypothetical protein
MNQSEIKDLFEYHAPDASMVTNMNLIRAAIVNAAVVIDENCPPGADRTAAIRKLKEAAMTANASIVLRGVSYR